MGLCNWVSTTSRNSHIDCNLIIIIIHTIIVTPPDDKCIYMVLTVASLSLCIANLIIIIIELACLANTHFTRIRIHSTANWMQIIKIYYNIRRLICMRMVNSNNIVRIDYYLSCIANINTGFVFSYWQNNIVGLLLINMISCCWLHAAIFISLN